VLSGCGGDEEGATGAAPAMTAATPAATMTDAGSTAAAAATRAIHLKLLSFEPGELHVAAGTTVEWVNDNPITHTVTSGTYEVGADGLRTSEQPDGTFDGDLAAQGDTFRHTFAEPGTYAYYCSIHKGMNATIVVAS
jgi:plastocyanin